MKPYQSMSVRVDGEGVWILDQTRLPHEELWLRCASTPDLVRFIRELKVRGAPLIGVSAALQLGWRSGNGASADELENEMAALREARPTAVNLMNAVDRMKRAMRERGPAALVREAEDICSEDAALCERMAMNGAQLVEKDDRLLTHCNTGGLATAGTGTALGVIVEAARQRKDPHVYVDETRPLLQGARLTTWELARHGIPHTLICDNMAASLMQAGKVDKVFVGADRIATNGDFANKIGTYGLAALCKFHGLPFYVVAPRTTIDRDCASGSDIPIEERGAQEVLRDWGKADTPVWNPAFDVTPADLVSAWVLDTGVFTRDDVRNGALVGG